MESIPNYSLTFYKILLYFRTLSSSVILPKTEQEKEAVAMREGDVFLQNVEYNNPGVLFPRAMVIIKSPEYRHHFLRGLVVSIGKSPDSSIVTTFYVDLQSVLVSLLTLV